MNKLELYILRKVESVILWIQYAFIIRFLGYTEKSKYFIYLEGKLHKVYSRKHDLIDFINQNKWEYNLQFSHQEKDWQGNIINVYKKT